MLNIPYSTVWSSALCSSFYLSTSLTSQASKPSPAGLATLWKSPVHDRKKKKKTRSPGKLHWPCYEQCQQNIKIFQAKLQTKSCRIGNTLKEPSPWEEEKKTWEALGSRTNLVMSDASRTSESCLLKDGCPHFFHNDGSHCQKLISGAGFLRVKCLHQPLACVLSHLLLCCKDKQQQTITTASQCSSEQDCPSAQESPYATLHLGNSSNVGLINIDPFTLKVKCSEQQIHGNLWRWMPNMILT